MNKPADDRGEPRNYWLWAGLALIVLLLAAVIGLSLSLVRPPASAKGLESDVGNPTLRVCFLAGDIYDRETGLPLSGVKVEYVRSKKDSSEYIHNVRSQLATSDDTGHFAANCAWVEDENFPLQITLSRPGWCSAYQSNEFIKMGETNISITLYVPDRVQRLVGCP